MFRKSRLRNEKNFVVKSHSCLLWPFNLMLPSFFLSSTHVECNSFLTSTSLFRFILCPSDHSQFLLNKRTVLLKRHYIHSNVTCILRLWITRKKVWQQQEGEYSSKLFKWRRDTRKRRTHARKQKGKKMTRKYVKTMKKAVCAEKYCVDEQKEEKEQEEQDEWRWRNNTRHPQEWQEKEMLCTRDRHFSKITRIIEKTCFVRRRDLFIDCLRHDMQPSFGHEQTRGRRVHHSIIWCSLDKTTTTTVTTKYQRQRWVYACCPSILLLDAQSCCWMHVSWLVFELSFFRFGSVRFVSLFCRRSSVSSHDSRTMETSKDRKEDDTRTTHK